MKWGKVAAVRGQSDRAGRVKGSGGWLCGCGQAGLDAQLLPPAPLAGCGRKGQRGKRRRVCLQTDSIGIPYRMPMNPQPEFSIVISSSTNSVQALLKVSSIKDAKNPEAKPTDFLVGMRTAG